MLIFNFFRINRLVGTISGKGDLSGTIASDKSVLSGEISNNILSYKKYLGPYTLIPRKIKQIFNTSDKVMTKDITLNAINYSEVDNLSGGKTVNIGYE